MARMSSRPKTVKVWFRGIEFALDLSACRRALVNHPFHGQRHRLDLERCWRRLHELEIEGELSGMRGLADAAGVSFSTVARFFSGRLPTMTAILKILAALHLTLDDVTLRSDGDD